MTTLAKKLLASLATVLLVSGCASHIGNRIVEAPGRDGGINAVIGDAAGEDVERLWSGMIEPGFFVDRIKTLSPVDQSRLSTFVLPAGRYIHEYTFDATEPGKFSMEFSVRTTHGPQPPAIGSVLFVHGWLGSYRQMFFHALGLAGHGWDGYLTDLRGHGYSEGEHVTFGVHESSDLAAVIDSIRDQPKFVEPLIVVGASMGGAVALLAAADNPDIDAVAALAPYADFKQILPDGMKTMAPGYLRPWLSPRKVEKALIHAENIANTRLDQAAPILVAEQISQPVMLIHGSRDRFVPLEQSQRLHELIANSEIVEFEQHSHIPLMLDRDPVIAILLPWLERIGYGSIGTNWQAVETASP